MSSPNGTAYYIAPEVLKGSYDKKCDIWSMGVVLYILLCGRPPFPGKCNEQIINNVIKGEYRMDYPAFDKVTPEAKDFIQKCLTKDPDERMSAAEAYEHDWIKRQWDAEEAKLEIPEDVPKNIQSFIDAVNFKKTTITFIASRIPEDEIVQLREAFIKLDKNGDGVLSKSELMDGVSEIPTCSIREEDWDLIMSVMDTNDSGSIDYIEFIAACMQSYVYLKENNLQNAFEYFDKDGNGTITLDELKQTLASDEVMLDPADVEAIINEVDVNEDGQIDYKEFMKMMQSGEGISQSLSKLASGTS